MKRWLASNTSASARRRSAMANAPEADALLDHPLNFRLHACAMLAGARPLLAERIDQQVEQRGVGVEFVAIGAMNGEQHALELVISGVGAVGRLAQFRLQRLQPRRADLLEQRGLRGKIAVDVGVRHAGVGGDADDGQTLGAEAANVLGGDGENAALHRLGRGCARVHARSVRARSLASARFSKRQATE